MSGAVDEHVSSAAPHVSGLQLPQVIAVAFSVPEHTEGVPVHYPVMSEM